METSNIRNLGVYLYTYFSFFLLLAGLILLVAMLGAIRWTLEGDTTIYNTKQQQLFKQLNVDPKNLYFMSYSKFIDGHLSFKGHL